LVVRDIRAVLKVVRARSQLMRQGIYAMEGGRELIGENASKKGCSLGRPAVLIN
jgi:hypothetical protein